VKNHYFGDVNDYRKYGLLRVLSHETGLRCLVAWMLTPDDGRPDGRLTQYLTHPDTWRSYDPDLFDTLRAAVSVRGIRDVDVIVSSGLLPGASFFPGIVPDQLPERTQWSDHLLAASVGHDLVFLDPDNGIEVKSKPIGCKDSSKFVCWRELNALFEKGASLLVYQHYPRRPRKEFTSALAERLSRQLGINQVITFSTSNVLFLLAPQSRHEHAMRSAAESIAEKWQGQFQVGEEATNNTSIDDTVAPFGAN